jgi:hypothetical protein
VVGTLLQVLPLPLVTLGAGFGAVRFFTGKGRGPHEVFLAAVGEMASFTEACVPPAAVSACDNRKVVPCPDDTDFLWVTFQAEGSAPGARAEKETRGVVPGDEEIPLVG